MDDKKIVELVERVQKILEYRANDPNRGISSQIAYSSAYCLVCSALAGDEETIREFDYNS